MSNRTVTASRDDHLRCVRLAAALAAACLIAACSVENGDPTSAADTAYDASTGLRGEVTGIPVFRPSMVTGRIEGGSFDGSTHCYTWFLESDASLGAILGWYDERMANAIKTPYDDGSAIWAFTVVGGDADAGERGTVLVTRDAEIEINECVKPYKRTA